MNPFKEFNDVLVTCADACVDSVVAFVLNSFNTEKTTASPPADRLVVSKYFAREVVLEFEYAYVGDAEQNMSKLRSAIFWEPANCPSRTALMVNFADGMSHGVFRLSELTEYSWLNIRIYRSPPYPGRCFDYYAKHRSVERRLVACRDDRGWVAIQHGPVQSFERVERYSRRLKRERLTEAMVVEYAEALGYRIADDEFWISSRPAWHLWQERHPLTE